MSQTRSVENNEMHDKVFTFKIFNNSGLLERLKTVSKHQVFMALKYFCSDEVKVIILL